MNDPSRRTFVKRSAATGITLSFAGLIRAHGEGGGGGTTNDPWGTTDSGATTSDTTVDWTTTFDATTDPWGTTEHETTVPTKPKKHSYFKTVGVTGEDGNGNPIFSEDEANAKKYTDRTSPPTPKVTGQPTDAAGVGTLKVEGIAMMSVGGTTINTSETGTKDLDPNITPNPKATFSTVDAPNDPDDTTPKFYKKFDVQVWYYWSYPSSP